MKSQKPQFIIKATDPKHGYDLFWTGVSYSRKREQAFRCDSIDFANTAASQCNRELSYLHFAVEPAT